MSAYHRFYRVITGPGCVYCGLRATTSDHFVPISVVGMLTECASIHTGRFLLPSCGECNALAGAKLFKTVAAKRRYIHDKLRRRHKHVLAVPAWSEAELEEMSWSLADYIRKGLEQRNVLLQRLAWRNTSNSSFVQIARIGFGRPGDGPSSVRPDVVNAPITGSVMPLRWQRRTASPDK